MDDLIAQHRDYIEQLKLVTGLSYTQIARQAGLAASTIVRFMSRPDWPHPLATGTLEKLRRTYGFGPGEPPVAQIEPALRRPAAAGALAEAQQRFSPGQVPKVRDVPIYEIAAQGDFPLEDGDATEALILSNAYSGKLAPRPGSLEGQAGLFAFYVPGHSMDPRFRMGELAIVDPKRPPRMGDDVLVTVGTLEDGCRSVLLKTLVGIDAAGIELEEYQPRRRFRVPAHRVLAIARILSIDELLQG